MHPTIPPIDPLQLKELLASGAAVTLVDVREPMEVKIVRIDGSLHIPMRTIPSRLAELDPKATTVVYCHHGMRSMQVGMYLVQNGFRDVRNLDGGIDHYAAVADPTLKRY